MAVDRRKFLKLAGLTALGASGSQCLDLLPGSEVLKAADHAVNTSKTRWAMVIDVKACSARGDCTRCMDVCHQVHAVPDIRLKNGEVDKQHEVKWLWKENFEKALPSQDHQFLGKGLKNLPVLVLCNHCDHPSCVRVCPTKATFRRHDGIVMMDYHRCIGCRYCVAACPYGSRSFNWSDPRPHIKAVDKNFPTRTKGVVEKCNFCAERLARRDPVTKKPLEPACVVACREVCNALVFGNLNDPSSDVRRVLKANYVIRRKPELGTNPEVYYIV